MHVRPACLQARPFTNAVQATHWLKLHTSPGAGQSLATVHAHWEPEHDVPQKRKTDDGGPPSAQAKQSLSTLSQQSAPGQPLDPAQLVRQTDFVAQKNPEPHPASFDTAASVAASLPPSAPDGPPSAPAVASAAPPSAVGAPASSLDVPSPTAVSPQPRRHTARTCVRRRVTAPPAMTSVKCTSCSSERTDRRRALRDQARQMPSSRSARGGTWLIACSAIAVIVRLGFTPRFAGMIEPSTT